MNKSEPSTGGAAWQVARRPLGRTGVEVSEIGLGGHEFADSSHIRGFHDDLWKSLTPGEIMPGFGEDARGAVIAAALERGVNFLEVTIDSEKEALGRNLHALGVSEDVVVQTRPCGFVYTYDPGNLSFLDREKLFREIERICGLLRRPYIDILNVGLDDKSFADGRYFAVLGANLKALKDAGLIRHAGCDTFSGGIAYETMIASGLFDVLYLIYNPLSDFAEEKVFPMVRDRGMGVLVKEAFLKGQIFKTALSMGIERERFGWVADVVLRWILRRSEISCALVGTSNVNHLLANLQASNRPPLNEEERAFIAHLRASEQGRLLRARQRWAFFHGLPPNLPPPADEIVLAELPE